MGKLTYLLKWKRAIGIKDSKGMAVRDEEGKPVVVYMRVIGDHDLDQAQKKARLASALKRAKLLDRTSEDHIINVEVFNDASREVCIELILQGQGANWSAEAYSETVVPELPKIEEFARDPDAPSLEELEELDAATARITEEYQRELATYIKTRQDVLTAELAEKSDEEIRERAKDNMVIIMTIETYLSTFRDEKVWRSVYSDEDYTIPEFKSIEEFLNLDASLKEQLREEYARLEEGLDEIKN